MEKAKPSKKKAYYKNLNRDSQRGGRVQNPSSLRLSATSKSSRYNFNDTDDSKSYGRRPIQASDSPLADLDEIWQETNVGQDFETLVNTPLAAHGHFVFKFERNWNLETSNYDDYFTLNVKELARIVECVPYNRYVRVDDKYFTKDELTDINNTADKGRKAYDRMMEAARETKNNEPETAEAGSSRARDKSIGSDSDSNASFDNDKEDDSCRDNSIEEDLEFLLSLKEPVRPRPVAVASLAKSGFEEPKPKNVPVPTKSIDLEKWLDLVLDD